MEPSVEYLGHIIDEKGLYATPSKIKAFVEAPIPNNLTQLRAFLELINYYNNFFSYSSPIKKSSQERAEMGLVSEMCTSI